jgi:RNA polymerase sigma-70 factor (ECF subfamily)
MEIERTLAAAAVAWPELPAPDEAFAQVVAKLDDAAHVGDLFLAHHASRGERVAVDEVRAMLDEQRGALRKTGATQQMIDELLAELPADLLAARDAAPARILGYTGKGPLGAWLRVVALRALVDRRRKAGVHGDDEHVATLAADDDPELAMLRRMYKGELEAAFVEAFRALPSDERLLLRQSHIDGLGIDRLALIHGIHRATAARRLAAARTRLFEQIRKILSTRLQIGHDTFASIVRLVRSELAVSLEHYL